MRKTISLILVAAMLMCGIMIPTSTSAAAVLEDNVAANANYFGGTLIYVENSGSKGDVYEEPMTVKEGASGTITLDGVIEPGEWGDVAVHVDSAYAASNKNAVGKWLKDIKNDAMYSHPSAENTYFYGTDSAVAAREFDYDLYFLWDEDFLYVAAHVNDPYNHANSKNSEEIWEGDALQFMVDPQGPNSAAVADGTTYAYLAEHGIKHTEKNGQKIVTYENAPWEGIVVKEGGFEKSYCPVPNFIVAYASGVSEAWDGALRYHPELEEYNGTDDSGNVVPMTRTKWSSAGISLGSLDRYWTDNYQDVSAYATVRPTNHGNIKEPDYTTDYEIAIPWEMVALSNDDGTFQDAIVPVDGTELGISVVVFNATKSSDAPGYDSWLGWGSGICGSQTMYDYQTAGGSNLLTLRSTGYKDYTACEHTFAEATCIAPETCTKCGYERGFEVGHSYVCTNEVLPSGEDAGSVVATCSVCGDIKNLTLKNDGTAPYYTFYSTDDQMSDKFGSGWSVNWYDIIDDPDVEGRQGNMLYYKDANGNLKAKTSFDTTTFGYSVADCATRGDGLFYADGNVATIADDIDITTQTGTYFDCDSFPASAFTYKIDVYPTDYAFVGKDKYVKGLYNWFGKKAADYMAGLFVFGGETENPTYLFAIASTDLCNNLYNDVEAFKAKCEVYKEVDYSVVAANEWHEHVFLYDDNSQYASLYWDGELMVSAHNPQFKYVNGGVMNAIYRRMNIPFYAKDIVVGRTAVASQFVGGTTPTTTYKATINGVEYDYEAGATVTVTASNGAFYLDGGRGLRFAGWTGDVEFADAASTETTFVMPANDVTVTESYFIVGDLNNDGKVNVTDANIIKKMITGSAAQIGAADINNDTKINAQDANNLKAMVLGKFTPSK